MVDVDQDCCCHMVVLLLHFDVLMMDYCHAVVPILDFVNSDRASNSTCEHGIIT